MVRKNLFYYGSLSIFIWIHSVLFSFQTNASRISELESQVSILQDQIHDMTSHTAMGEKGIKTKKARPDIQGKGWVISGEALAWYVKANGTAFAYRNHENMISSPIEGKTEDIRYHWHQGYRFGVEKHFDHDEWDLSLYLTCYLASNSGHAQKGALNGLVPLRGFFALNQVIDHARSSYVFHDYHLDLQLGRDYFVSSKLAMHPFFGIKNAWINQKQMISYSGGSFLGFNIAKIEDTCKYWGIGPRFGVDSKWFVGQGFYLFSLLSGSFVYGNFGINHKEEITAQPQDHIRINDDKHRLIPTMEWNGGLGFGRYLNNHSQFVRVELGYEGIYWWHLNQMVRVHNAQAFHYDNMSEDISVHGLTLKGSLCF